MNLDKRFILLTSIVFSYCVLVNGKFNLKKLERTWIVRNTSDVNERDNCPFLFVKNATQNGTAKLTYSADNHPDIMVTLKDVNNTMKLLNNQGSIVGDFNILKDNAPYFMLIQINSTTKGIPPYIVLTGYYDLPEVMNRNISQFWITHNATKNVTLYSTQQTRTRCDQFLINWNMPAIPSLNINDTMIPSGKNGTTNVTEKPKIPKNDASSPISSLLFTLIFVYLCFLRKTFN